MRKFQALALALLGLTSVGGSPAGLIPSFGLFNIVNFKNNECDGVKNNQATGLKGTCLSTTECSSQNGSPEGNCAAGFGVCCIFRKAGCTSQTVTKNGTYITNPEFPQTEAATPALNCEYTIDVPRPGEETCQVRLDFTDVVLQPGANGLVDGATTSNIEVTGGSGVNPPLVAGTLSGMHMYVNTGAANPKINIDKLDGQANAKWEIRVSFIHCNSPWRAPDGCTQYYKENAGMIRSYNNDCKGTAVDGANFLTNKELTSQNNRICIRQNAGSSQIKYTGTPQFIVGEADALAANQKSNLGAAMCGAIANLLINTNDIFCGEQLAPAAGQTAPGAIFQNAPFRLNHNSPAAAVAGTTGFCIMYSQV